MSTTTTVPRLKAKYNDEIRDQLRADLELGNIMEVPRLEKIVVNVGVGAAVDNKGLLEKVVAAIKQYPAIEYRMRMEGMPGRMQLELLIDNLRKEIQRIKDAEKGNRGGGGSSSGGGRGLGGGMGGRRGS